MYHTPWLDNKDGYVCTSLTIYSVTVVSYQEAWERDADDRHIEDQTVIYSNLVSLSHVIVFFCQVFLEPKLKKNPGKYKTSYEQALDLRERSSELFGNPSLLTFGLWQNLSSFVHACLHCLNARPRYLQLLLYQTLRQYLYFCTSKASKLSTLLASSTLLRKSSAPQVSVFVLLYQ